MWSPSKTSMWNIAELRVYDSVKEVPRASIWRLTAKPNPWEIQLDETGKAFDAFRLYRDQGPQRSTRQVALTLGKSGALINRWSSQHQWVRRVALWDRHLDRQGQLEAIEARKDMASRHARVSSLVLSKAMQRLVGDENNNVTALDLNTLTANDVARLIDLAVKVERVSRGEPDRIDRVDVVGQLGLDANDRSLLEKVASFAAARRGLSTAAPEPDDEE